MRPRAKDFQRLAGVAPSAMHSHVEALELQRERRQRHPQMARFLSARGIAATANGFRVASFPPGNVGGNIDAIVQPAESGVAAGVPATEGARPGAG